MFYTQYNKLRATPEKNSGVYLVEKAGYVSAQKRIEALILAGQRLVQSRIDAYDFDKEIDEDFEDPTRNPGYDMADAFQDNLSVQSRIKASQTVQKQRIDVVDDADDVDVKESLKKALEP